MKEEREKYDSIIAFELRTMFGEQKQIGILYNIEDAPVEHNKALLEWCIGAWKWAEDGNWITEEREWLDRSANTTYEDGDDFIVEYCKIAYDENPVIYFYFENFGTLLSKQKDNLFTCDEFKDWVIEQIQEEYWRDPECDYDY